MHHVRRPAVAGTFYPADPRELQALVEEFTTGRIPAAAFGAIAPHAGLIYSGACAGKVYARVEIPPLTVVLAPNHTGMGSFPARAGYWGEGAFRTPLGESKVDNEFIQTLGESTDLVVEDRAQHMAEHAVEVQLPFLQLLAPETMIAPLVLPWDDWNRCKELAAALAGVISAWPTKVLLIASSDMNHYESAETALRKDTAVLEAVTKLDGEALLSTCEKMHVTMCGRAPAAVLVETSHILGAEVATVVDYRHSGMVTGDESSVVSYAGVVVT